MGNSLINEVCNESGGGMTDDLRKTIKLGLVSEMRVRTHLVIALERTSELTDQSRQNQLSDLR